MKDAAHGAAGQQKLDIDWIDQLPAHLKTSIDLGFAEEKADAKATRDAAPDLKKVDVDITKQEDDLKKATVARLKAAGHPASDTAVAADSDYKAKRTELEAARKRRKDDAVIAVKDTEDVSVPSGERREQSVTRPDQAKVARQEGQALARTNFMSWAVDVLGSSAAAKAHFKSVRLVENHEKGTQMWLAGSAATRFEAALADFEAKNPGYTFPTTDTAQESRGFHEARKGVGMLGHALGEAFDFLAIDNINIKEKQDPNDRRTYGYLLNKFGSSNTEGGRSTMALGDHADDRIEQLGRDTIADPDAPLSADGKAMVDLVRKQFDEMFATSTRLKESMAPQLAELQEARKIYYGRAALTAKLKDAKKKLADGDKGAMREVAEQAAAEAAEAKAAAANAPKPAQTEKPAPVAAQTPDQAKAKIVAAQAALKSRVVELEDKLRAAKSSVDTKLDHAFTTWREQIQKDIDGDHAKQATNASGHAGLQKETADLTSIDVGTPDANDNLTKFATENGLTPLDHMKVKGRPETPKKYKEALLAEQKVKNAPKEERLGKSDTYLHNELAELDHWQLVLKDPEAVFGPPGKPTADGEPTSKYDASAVPVMQLLEHGFVRNDPMPPSAGGGRKKVYNTEVVATLTRFGWAPGATFGDSMHYDFIQGYNSAVPGGRSMKNMGPRYSPEGDPVPPPAKGAKPAAVAPNSSTVPKPAPAATVPKK